MDNCNLNFTDYTIPRIIFGYILFIYGIIKSQIVIKKYFNIVDELKIEHQLLEGKITSNIQNNQPIIFTEEDYYYRLTTYKDSIQQTFDGNNYLYVNQNIIDSYSGFREYFKKKETIKPDGTIISFEYKDNDNNIQTEQLLKEHVEDIQTYIKKNIRKNLSNNNKTYVYYGIKKNVAVTKLINSNKYFIGNRESVLKNLKTNVRKNNIKNIILTFLILFVSLLLLNNAFYNINFNINNCEQILFKKVQILEFLYYIKDTVKFVYKLKYITYLLIPSFIMGISFAIHKLLKF